jgi:hypothetical protein
VGESRFGRGDMGLPFSSDHGKWIVSGGSEEGVCWTGILSFGRALGLFGPAGGGGVEKRATNFGMDGSTDISFFSLRGMGDLEGSM